MPDREIPELHDGPEMPAGAEFLWGWFLDLHAGRGSSGFGPNPLSWPDLQAWCHLTGTDLRPWQIHLMRRLDAIYLSVVAEASKQ